MPTFGNRARVSTATTGTGTITLGSPVTGLQSFAAAGVLDYSTVRYVIEDGTAWEIGTGLYIASGTTLERGPIQSSIGGAEINLSGAAQVFLSVAAEDMAQLTDIQEFTTVGTTTWIKPVGALYIHGIMYGGGGAGGSGHDGLIGTPSGSSAGGSGGAAARIEFYLPAFDIGETVSLTIGAGGTGGASRAGGGNGNPGTGVQNTTFGPFVARGGTSGGGGTATTGTVGIANGDNSCFVTGSTRYTGNGAAGGLGTASDAGRGGLGAGGGGGAGGTASGVITARAGGAGGQGGSAALTSNTTQNGGGGAGGPDTGGNGADGADSPDLYFGGSGGGGGGVNATATVVGNGGNGGFPGGGGGAGSYGKVDAGTASGAGGNGGNGAVRITTFF